jgi:hypothetical protein
MICGQKTLYIPPAGPCENEHGESFNLKLRDEFLNVRSHTRLRRCGSG